ncbi:MAG: hypothetical protein IPH12_15770, partial [Saprospirales bacterium]|nr:hypothetical protein [Saprospirales bacterium]
MRLVLAGATMLFSLFHIQSMQAQTYIFNNDILASNNPFSLVPAGTDTIIIRDSFSIDINYEPIIGGVPFEGLLIVDGGVMHWSSNVYFKLGYAARLILINGGVLKPVSSNSPDCSPVKALYFDTKKTVNCNGVGAPHAFSDVNNAGCVTEIGICCNAFIVATDSSGNYNDRTLCAPGDTAHLSVIGSGALGYDYLWSPNIGPEGGIYPVAPLNNTVYSVGMSAIFDPYGPDPAYLLTCGGSVQIKINPVINLSSTTTSVPYANVPTGSITLTVSGGTPPYSYFWSSGQTTKSLSGIPAGTYTVSVKDTKGCEYVHTATVLVQDNTPPTLSCPPNATGTANPNVCTTLIPNINAVFSDNCPTVGVTYTLTGATTGSGGGQLSNTVPFSSGITTVTYKVDDGANAVTCSFKVTVNDTQFPTASNPAPITGLTCLADVPAPNPAVVTNEADNCGAPAVTHIGDVNAGGGGCPGDTLVLLRRYRVSDAAGNSITVTQTIRVVDNLPPTFTAFPGPAVVNCQSIPAVASPTATDNCAGAVTISYLGEQHLDGACADNYTLIRRWRATDNCGNSIQSSQTITVQDITPPVFTGIPAGVTVNCNAIPAVATPVATDNCDAGVMITYDGQTRTNGACQDAYSLRRRWTATDNCGNTATIEQVIVVQDMTKPAFTFVPANLTVSCNAVPAVGAPLASDNCDGSVAITYDGQTRANGACPDTYTLRRRWTASDNCGNTATAEQQISVQDIIQPVFTNIPANATVSCDAIPAIGTPMASDNCSATVAIVFVDEVRTNGACPDTYMLRRQWRATDDCGNTATATQLITVQDITKPNFSFVPANITLSCDAIPPVGTPVATDNCDASVTINYDGQLRVDGPCPDHYTLLRRWTATDNCGNTRTAEQAITIQDTSKPVFTSVPAGITVSCSAIPPAGSPTATDNCDAAVAISYNGETRVNGACTDNYTLIRRWTAADNCGNTATAEQALVVQDLTPPVFTFIPVNATVNCEAIPSLGTPLATDNCDGNVAITFAGITQNSGNCASGGTVVRRWIAADNCGNTALAEQLLTVQDTTKPVFTQTPANVTVSCESVPAPGTPIATDNCTTTVDILYDGQVRTDGSCPDTYTLTRQWTAVDVCGNTVSTRQVITVRDLIAPVFTSVPAYITVDCESVPAAGSPVATDNCDAAVAITYNGELRTNGACPNAYSLLRRWTATDNCGNTKSATQTIVVQDSTKPVFTFFPADTMVNCANIPSVGTPVASDNCTATVQITYGGQTRENGPCSDTYVLRRRWTITDACGNSQSAVQTITVQDVTKPIFTFVPADATVSCDAVPAVGTPAASDNCATNMAISYDGQTRQDGACPDTYILKRQWSVADNCGNSVSAVQTITVQDISKPVFTSVPADATVDCQSVPSVGAPTVSDNCDASVTVSYDGETRVDGACPDTYTLLRKWTAADNCGNTQSTVQKIQVQDTGRPAFTFVPADQTVDCASVPPVGTPAASDNCDGAVAITYDGEIRLNGACPDTYTLLRRWTASDNCGNTQQVEQVIAVQDVLPPVFSFVPADQTLTCDAVPIAGTPEASDNCTANVTIEYKGEVRSNGACPDSYTLFRRWAATDECGNSSTAEQLLTVQDAEKPVFSFVPADITVDCAAVPAAEPPVASDNCAATVSITYNGEERQDGACPDSYILIRRWTASDACGNKDQAVQKITVEDHLKPAFTFVPASVTVNCDEVPAVGLPAASDNCTAAVTISFDGETRTDGSCPDAYVLTRRWTATDNCGNAVTAEQTLAIQDTEKPVFTFVPPDATVNCEAIPAMGMPAATDNCDQNVSISVTTEILTGGDCSSGGMLIRRWTAADNCGNTALAEQHLTVQDTTRPVFTFVLPNVTVACESVPAIGTPTATDNCTVNVEITFDGEQRTDGPCPDTYILRRRWTARDICGNARTVQQFVTVIDTKAPVFAAVPANVTVSCEAVPAVGVPVATDNCDAGVSINFDGETRIDGACQDSYTLQRKWTASDNCGNTVSTVQIITVQDNLPPAFTLVPPSLTSSCAAVPPVGIPTATDNCDTNVSITFDGETRTNGACQDSYTLRRQWTASDNCGNTLSALQIITVQDNTPPAFTSVPANATVNCDAVPVVATPIASDNCASAVTITFGGET